MAYYKLTHIFISEVPPSPHDIRYANKYLVTCMSSLLHATMTANSAGGGWAWGAPAVLLGTQHRGVSCRRRLLGGS